MKSETKVKEEDIAKLIISADAIIENTVKRINQEIVAMYWNLGKIITKYKNKNNSGYGDAVIKRFSKELTLKYGSGFGETNTKYAVRFYLQFLKSPLGDFFKDVPWSHYREILLINDQDKVIFYLNEIIHRIDLIFYDGDTGTYILMDLKINKISNQDLIQMKMYIKYFNEEKHISNTLGVILVETKDLRIIKSKDVYQIKYLNEMPKKNELQKIINENKVILLKTESLKL